MWLDLIPAWVLKDAFVLRRGVKMKVQRVPGKIHVNYIWSADDHCAIELAALALNVNSFLREWDVIVLGLLEDGFLDVRLALGSVTVACSFVLESILKLVVLEEWRDDFHAH